MARRDFRRILPFENQELETAQGKWLASVRDYPADVPTSRDLIHIKLDFKLEGAEDASRSLDLWLQNAPDITLVAEYAGLLQPISRWLDDSQGDAELLYDSASGKLRPFHSRDIGTS